MHQPRAPAHNLICEFSLEARSQISYRYRMMLGISNLVYFNIGVFVSAGDGKKKDSKAFPEFNPVLNYS